MPRQIRHQAPRAWTGDTRALLHIVSRVCGSYTRGVFLDALIVGLMTALGSFVIGLEAWMLLGVIALVAEIVPVFGFWIALGVSAPLVLVTQPDRALLALGLFLSVQLLDNLVLGPRVQGGSLHFSTLVSLLLLAAGGIVAGPLGVILALPLAALLRDVGRYASYRAGGLAPAMALSRLTSFQRGSERPAHAVEATSGTPEPA